MYMSTSVCVWVFNWKQKNKITKNNWNGSFVVYILFFFSLKMQNENGNGNGNENFI